MLSSQNYRHLIDRLRALGLDKHVDLPQVAVMGDTSSGKSSVLSALSGIEFPSSEKLTTRCATQLILSDAETFSGTIRLQRYTPKPTEVLKPIKLTRIEDIAKNIQLLTQKLVDEGQSISDDSIVVKISGPNFPNLTLTDLPGLIRTVGDNEDDSIIGRVRALVDRYLHQRRTIILAVVPANVDIHNNEILTDAKAVDPEGLRTLAIITKPDLIDEGAEGSVIDLLMNKTKVLKLGYHAVKCRGQKALNNKISIEDSLRIEAEFFETHPSWYNVESKLLGVSRLGEKLVKLLEESIAAALPDVLREIDLKLSKCKNELSNLGQALETAQSRRNFYSVAVESFTEFLKASISGRYDELANPSFFASANEGAVVRKDALEDDQDCRLRSALRKKENEFKDKISRTRAESLWTNSMGKPFENGQILEVRSAENSDVWNTVELTSIDLKMVNNRWTQTFLCSDGNNYSENNARHPRVLNLETLKKQIADNRGDELAIFPSYSIFCLIVRNAVMKWKDPTQDLFSSYNLKFQRITKLAIATIKQSKKIAYIFEYTTMQVIADLQKKTKAALQHAIETELRPYTLNTYLYDSLIKLRNEPLLGALKAISNADKMVNMDVVLAVLKNHGVGNVSNEDKEAMEMHMAISAYMDIARKRFIDSIPMILQQHFVGPFLKEVKAQLMISDEKLEMVLVEDENLVRRRGNLKMSLESLKKSKEEVSGLS